MKIIFRNGFIYFQGRLTTMSNETQNRRDYLTWITDQKGLTENTAKEYAAAIANTAKQLPITSKPLIPSSNLFSYNDIKIFQYVKSLIIQDQNFKAVNKKSSGAFAAALQKYEQFLTDKKMVSINTANRELFITWMTRTNLRKNGLPYLQTTANNYASALSSSTKQLTSQTKVQVFTDLFKYNEATTFISAKQIIMKDPNFNTVNAKSNGSFKAGLAQYESFLVSGANVNVSIKNKALFKSWATTELVNPLAPTVATDYAAALGNSTRQLTIAKQKEVESNLFKYDDVINFKIAEQKIKKDANFNTVDKKSSGAFSAAMKKYELFLSER
jgi:hypothetical protein